MLLTNIDVNECNNEEYNDCHHVKGNGFGWRFLIQGNGNIPMIIFLLKLNTFLYR